MKVKRIKFHATNKEKDANDIIEKFKINRNNLISINETKYGIIIWFWDN